MSNIKISGFADEISPILEEQLKGVKSMGLKYICLRTANNKNISDYTLQEACKVILPMLKEYGIQISSIGSPIGKTFIDEDFEKDKEKMNTLCSIANLLNVKYIRIFSYFIKDYQNDGELVIERLSTLADIARTYNVTLLHENEKETYGDTALRCSELYKRVNKSNFKLIYDFANFMECGEDTIASYNLLKEYISYIHIKDMDNDGKNVYCGMGEARIKEILTKAIKEDNYKGFLTLEPHISAYYGNGGLLNKDSDLTGYDTYRGHLDGLVKILSQLEEDYE